MDLSYKKWSGLLPTAQHLTLVRGQALEQFMLAHSLSALRVTSVELRFGLLLVFKVKPVDPVSLVSLKNNKTKFT